MLWCQPAKNWMYHLTQLQQLQEVRVQVDMVHIFLLAPSNSPQRGKQTGWGRSRKSQEFYICQAVMPRTEVDQVQPDVWPSWSAPWAQRDLISSTALLRVPASFWLMKATSWLSHRTTKQYGTAGKIHGIWSLAYLGSRNDPIANHLNYWWSLTSSPELSFLTCKIGMLPPAPQHPAQFLTLGKHPLHLLPLDPLKTLFLWDPRRNPHLWYHF